MDIALIRTDDITDNTVKKAPHKYSASKNSQSRQQMEYQLKSFSQMLEILCVGGNDSETNKQRQKSSQNAEWICDRRPAGFVKSVYRNKHDRAVKTERTENAEHRAVYVEDVILAPKGNLAVQFWIHIGYLLFHLI